MSLSEDKTQDAARPTDSNHGNGGSANEIEAALREIRRVTTDLEQKLRLARGTRERVSPPAAVVAKVHPVPIPAPRPTLRQRVELALTRESLGVQQLARTVGEPVGKVADVMRELRREKVVYNVGLEDSPVWTWRVGNDVSAPRLREQVLRLISERPMTTREISVATGASFGRVGGQLVEIQRDPKVKIVDLSPHHAGRWFVISDLARDAHLAPKGSVVPEKKSG